MACLQEDCAYWDGDGCPCRVLDLEPVDVREVEDGVFGDPLIHALLTRPDLRTPHPDGAP